MMTKEKSLDNDVYQLKVTLLRTHPPIWRRILIPGNLSLEKLHKVLQRTMGWKNSHLHEFRIGRKRFGVPDIDDSFSEGTGCIDERTVRLSDVLASVGAKANYIYDFGDNWEHSILVEKLLSPEPGLAYPICTEGKRRGPPEDCGGVGGYSDFLEAIHDPQHEEHDKWLDWIGGVFDPEVFSVDEVNRRLTPLQRSRQGLNSPLALSEGR